LHSRRVRRSVIGFLLQAMEMGRRKVLFENKATPSMGLRPQNKRGEEKIFREAYHSQL